MRRMKIYIHEKDNWTDFTWDNKKVMIKIRTKKTITPKSGSLNSIKKVFISYKPPRHNHL